MNKPLNTILVTGGAGYIGSVLTGLLLQHSYGVRVLDRLSYGGESLAAYAANPNFELIQGEITDPAAVGKAIAGVDAVIHLAAIVGDPACRKFPDLAVKTNKDGAELVCKSAIDNGVRRFVFASTCSNYGKMDDPDGYVNETSPLKPISLYAELKVGFEQYLLAQKKDGFSPVCLRFATAHGISPRPRFDLTVNEFTRQLVTGRPLEIWGEQFWRPYCHTYDLSRACLAAVTAESSAVSGQAFNVGDTGENYQKKTLAEMILSELSGTKPEVRYVHSEEDPRDYRVNFDKISTSLGFSCTRKVIDGIREYISAITSGLIKDPFDKRYCNL